MREGWVREKKKMRAMEARESNEHIDLIRLIVLQLISTVAPVTKMKGWQQSEINWVWLFFVSLPSEFGDVSKGFGRQGICKVSWLRLSTCQPSSTLQSEYDLKTSNTFMGAYASQTQIWESETGQWEYGSLEHLTVS